jgi:hypothetical protein
VDINLWPNVFFVNKPELGDTNVRIGTLCRDLSLPLDLPDNCESELPFMVMNISDEGYGGYVYMQHASMWDYSKVLGALRLFQILYFSQTCPDACRWALCCCRRYQLAGWNAGTGKGRLK